MPTFEFTSPEGKTYEVEGPEGATQEQAFSILQSQLGKKPTAPTKPPAPPPDLKAAPSQSPVADWVSGKLGQVGDFLSDKPPGVDTTPGEIVTNALIRPAQRYMRDIGSRGIMGATVESKANEPLIRRDAADTLMNVAPLAGKAIGAFPKVAEGAAPKIVDALQGPMTAIESKVGKAAKYPADLVGRLRGTTAKELAEQLRTSTAAAAGEKVAGIESALAPVRKQAGAVDKALQSLGAQTKVAGERAAARALDPAAATAEKAAVRERMAAARVAAEGRMKAAGLSEQQAKAAVDAAESAAENARKGVEALEQDLAARPMATKEEFGANVRALVEGIRDRLVQERTNAAGFGRVIAEAGSEGRVDTAPIIAEINRLRENVRNPNLESVLNRIEATITEGGERGAGGMQAEMNALFEPPTPAAPQNLSIGQAESFRKYLNSIIETRQIKDMSGTAMAVDKETLAVVSRLANQLDEVATAAGDPFREAYGQALQTFREMSRPLDLFERKGPLSAMRAADPVSEAYRMSEAQVADAIIQKANAGHPVFERLLAESPELRDAARMAFSRDLFGGETQVNMGQWLRRNERSLRQLGLYDEFRDLKTARETANNLVKEADVGVREAKAGATEAGKAAREAEGEARKATSLSKKSETRLSDAMRAVQADAEVPKDVTQRAASARSALESKAREFGRTIEQQQKVQERFSTLQTRIQNAPPKKIASEIRQIGKTMVDEGVITQAQYAEMLQGANRVEQAFGDSAKAKKELMRIGVGIGVLTGSWGAYKLGLMTP